MTKLKKFLSPLLVALYKILFIVIGKLPVKRNLVIFESFLGKQYSCNPRAIYEYMDMHFPEYQLIWSVDPRSVSQFKKREIPFVKRFSIPWLFRLARAEYWVTNSRMPVWLPKPNHTTYLQTWHGTPLKKLAFDLETIYMAGTNTDDYKKSFYTESRNWDYLIAANQYSSDIFRTAFKFSESMLVTGYPRNDYLVNNKLDKSDMIRKLNLPKDKKIILYAPTWRDDQYHSAGRYKLELELDFKKLKDELGEEYIVLLRTHYLVSENIDLSNLEEFVYDYSSYEDIRDLYIIADVLITDYSSVFFDFLNLGRPVIFFVYDIDTYRDKLRGFYFNILEQAPGPLVKTTEEVIEHIKKYEVDQSLPSTFHSFYEKFCSLEDGEATKRVVDEVFNKAK